MSQMIPFDKSTNETSDVCHFLNAVYEKLEQAEKAVSEGLMSDAMSTIREIKMKYGI